MFGYGRDTHKSDYGVPVLPLTPAASEVERAMSDFRKELGAKAMYFTKGKAKEFPVLKILLSQTGKEDIVFQHPFDNVEEVYSLAEQSQVGTAKKTLFRLDARSSREFSKIEVLNQTWSDMVTSVCDQIRQVLAPGATKVTANLYKLLLYREGDFFNRHQDAQLSARMFATLLFFLPVDHEGGEFSIQDPGDYQNNTKIEKANSECTWVAFYTDVRHEVPKVTKGYRVVCNYSLSFEGAMSPSPQLPSLSTSVASVIGSYFSVHKKNMIAIPLSYEYTLATLFPEYLKGIDAYIYSALNQVSVLDLQFVMHFEKTRVIPGYEESDHEQVFQGVFTIKHEIAKRFFEVSNEKERRIEELAKEPWEQHTKVRKECDAKYLELMREVKDSQESPQTEWIVKRRLSGNPENIRNSNIYFDYGELGWLGNMSPAEEYYYLSAAIVVQKK